MNDFLFILVNLIEWFIDFLLRTVCFQATHTGCLSTYLAR
jgi:hypothetical protein